MKSRIQRERDKDYFKGARAFSSAIMIFCFPGVTGTKKKKKKDNKRRSEFKNQLTG